MINDDLLLIIGIEERGSMMDEKGNIEYRTRNVEYRREERII
jgi:hypothetical protein